MIAQILLISLIYSIDGPFCRGHFSPFKKVFSIMDLDYYLPRYKDMNSLSVFKAILLTFVGGVILF